ncbi:MAG: tyrosine-type recombinase/integrase [Blastocatellia bacterium]
MGKVRSGSIRERSTAYYAQVSYTDQNSHTKKLERQADSQRQAQQLIKHILRELTGENDFTVISHRVRERRGGIFARITFTDERGNRREVERRANNRTHAKEIIKQLLRDLDDEGEQVLNAARMTFADLAGYYEKNYLMEPEYIDGRKVAGLRSYYGMRIRLRTLKDYFGRHKVRTITHGDIRRFRAERIKTSTKHGKQRSITTVNRELQILRRVFNIALSNGWVKQNPFDMGDALITPGDEKKRERIITRQEEENLLAACTGKREHIRPIIICALDTGMRKGEMLKLVASDVDFENRVITVRAFNTKTMRERQVAMTDRLARELEVLVEKLADNPEALLFGILDDFKKAFTTARKAALLPDVRFHDLRHTHATRLVAAHLPLSEVGRALGHTQANTTFRYVNANIETARRVAAVLDEFNKPVVESDDVMIN